MTISPCTVATVGFVTDEVTVTEGKEFLECVGVTYPSPDIGMQLNFYLMVNFIPLTAGVCVIVYREIMCSAMFAYVSVFACMHAHV